MNIWVSSIAPRAWGILQSQSCLKFSIAFAVSNCAIRNFINWGDNLNTSVQNSQVTVTSVDFPIANIFETVRKEFPADRCYKATVTCFSMELRFSKRGRTRSTSFSKFKPLIWKSNFHWSWKSLELRFSRILLKHFCSRSRCQTERVFGRISKQLNKLLK